MPSSSLSTRTWPSSIESGWLSPDGRLTACPSGRHAEWIERLTGLAERGAERLGWIKLASGEWITADVDRPASQAQLTTIWSWCRGAGLGPPFWLMP